jgi:hypothetical protein
MKINKSNVSKSSSGNSSKSVSGTTYIQSSDSVSYADKSGHAALADEATVADNLSPRSSDWETIDDKDTATKEAALVEASKRFLSKLDDDTAAGIITFLQKSIHAGGIQIGKDFITGLLGQGGYIDGNGRGELRSLRLWETLEVPEIRYNKITVWTGVYWQTFGAGIIESVTIDKDNNGNELQSGEITLHLEEGEYGAVEVDDLCMGIYHNFNGSNDTFNKDAQNGNFHFKGFQSVYFRITEITDTSNNGKFKYQLRGASENWTALNHPQASMHFAAYANPTNNDRQSCSYRTTAYTVMLENMTTWEYGESNIYYVCGKLDGFAINGKKFNGNGIVFGNAYMYGSIDKFERKERVMSFDVKGDNMVAQGESKEIQAEIKDGYGEDVTDEYTSWSIKRETNDAASDLIWNEYSGIKNGLFHLSWDDMGKANSAFFIITASKSGENVTAQIEL